MGETGEEKASVGCWKRTVKRVTRQGVTNGSQRRWCDQVYVKAAKGESPNLKLMMETVSGRVLQGWH